MFEYDPEKSAINLAKHGIDFEQAQALWKDDDIVTIEARSDEEWRMLVTGMIEDKYWSAVVTRRGDNVRMISVRRARQNEVERYDRQKDQRG